MSKFFVLLFLLTAVFHPAFGQSSGLREFVVADTAYYDADSVTLLVFVSEDFYSDYGMMYHGDTITEPQDFVFHREAELRGLLAANQMPFRFFRIRSVNGIRVQELALTAGSDDALKAYQQLLKPLDYVDLRLGPVQYAGCYDDNREVVRARLEGKARDKAASLAKIEKGRMGRLVLLAQGPPTGAKVENPALQVWQKKAYKVDFEKLRQVDVRWARYGMELILD